MEQAIIIAAILMFGYGIFSKLADRSPISAPMVFVSAGILLSPLCFGLFSVSIHSEVVKILAEFTLIILLFTEASTISLRSLVKEYKIPTRLLTIGLPLTMALGICVGLLLFPSINGWAIAVMALILSPTDAALSQPVVNNQHIPHITRDAIAIESGLNDGIALPPILACIAALAATKMAGHGVGHWIQFLFAQIFLGLIIGSLVGFCGGRIIIHAWKKQWINQTFIRLSSLALAILAYSLATALTGNGFIAAFCGGFVLGTQIKPIKHAVVEFGETEGQQLTLFVFLLFGLVLVPISAPRWSWNALIYSLLSLTFIRMIPVLICLIGSKLNFATKVFIGWFGPRGMASVLYLLMFVAMVGAGQYDEMLSVITLTVLISVFAHGLSAVPLTKLYRHYV